MVAATPETLGGDQGVGGEPHANGSAPLAEKPRKEGWKFGRDKEAPLIRELLDLRGGEQLLDVGGGSGRFTVRFTAGCASVVVLEPNAKRVDRGRRRRPAIHFDLGRGETIPYGPESFDRVTAIRSTHHMESADRFLGEAFRVLRPGGRILLEELGSASWIGHLLGRLLHSHHSGALDVRGPTEWEEALSRAGFGGTRTVLARRWFFAVGTKGISPSA